MGASAAQLTAVVTVQNADKAKSDLQDIGKGADQTQKSFGDMMKQGLANAASFAIFNVGASAVGFLKNQISDTIQVAMQHEQVMAQTAAAIQSTGGAAGMTAQSISDLALSLSKTTMFSDDTIQSGENLLLTFKGIGKDVFPATTQTMLDMAQAMHQGPTQAAMMLGKALNDPTTGLSALTRVGVTFSDQEKEQIKTMMAHNDVAGAQKVMLQELQSEFGKSAEKAGQTFGGQLQILKNNLEDVKQKIGTALLPILGQFTGWLSSTALPLLDRFGGWFTGTAVPAMQNFGTVVGNIFTYVGNVLRTVPIADFQNAWKSVSGEVEYVAGKFGELIGSLNPLSPLLKQVTTDFDPVADIIQNLAKGALSVVTNLFRGTATALAEMTNAVQNGKGPYADFFAALSNIGNLLKGEFGKELKDLGQDAQQVGHWFMTSVVPAIKDALPGFENLGNTILTTVVPAVIQIRGVFVDVIQHAFEKFAPILEKIVPPLIRFAGILANDVANGLKFITPYVTQAAQAVGKFADEIMDRVAPIIDQWIKALTPLVQEFMAGWKIAWPQISGVLKGVWDEIVGVIKIAWAIVSGIVKIGLDILSGNWKQAWADFKTMLSGVWDGIKTYLSGAWEIIKGIFSGAFAGIAAIFGGIGQWFHDRFTEAWNAVMSVFSNLGQALMTFWNNEVQGWENIGQWFHDRFTDAWNAITGIFSHLGQYLMTFWNNEVQGWENIGGWFHDRFTEAWNNITGVFSGIGNWFHDTFNDVYNKIKDIIGNLGPDALKWAQDMINQFIQGIEDGITGVGNVVQKIASKISSFIHFSKPDVGPLADVDNWMPDFGDLLAKGLNDQLSKVSGASLKLATSMAVNMNPVNNPGLTAIPAGTSGIPSSLSNSQQQIVVYVQSPDINLDGRNVAKGVGPHLVNMTRGSGPIRSNLQ